MKISIRVYRILAKVLLAAVVLVFVGVIAFLGLQVSGRNKLYGNSDSVRPDMTLAGISSSADTENAPGGQNAGSSAADGQAGTAGEQLQNSTGEDEWQEGDVRYQGVHYRYNEDILTFLFLGIDKMTEVKTAKNGIDGGQSDAIFLLVLNPHNKEISIIGIPRDTMTDIDVYSKQGSYMGTTVAQLTLQHGYGDGAAASCERSRKAVSKLFYNLPIHGYCAINMGAIPLINDAVGGIEVQALEDVAGTDMKSGETIHLKGMDAYYYLHNRDTASPESAGRRLERQKQYLTAYAAAATKTMKNDITLPVTLYGTLSKYMVTDISLDEVSYLAAQAAGYRFDSDNMYSLTGNTVMGEEFEEFYVDETALYELILKVFYEDVDQE